MNDEKIYFNLGDKVILNKDIDDCPIMIVEKIEKEGDMLVGIKCFWFDTHKRVHSYVFSTKDLEKV